jgi:hypothetical protein
MRSRRRKNKFKKRNPIAQRLREDGPKPLRVEDKRRKLEAKEAEKEMREGYHD